MYPSYIWKQNSKPENQVIILRIPNREGCHYPAGNKLPTLLTEMLTKLDNDFCCLNCPHSFWTKNIKTHEIIC